MSYWRKNPKVKAKIELLVQKLQGQRSQGQSENDELLAQKSKAISKNRRLMAQKSQGFSKNNELLKQ